MEMRIFMNDDQDFEEQHTYTDFFTNRCRKNLRCRHIRPKQKIKPNIVQGNRPFYLRHRISFEKLCTVFDKT